MHRDDRELLGRTAQLGVEPLEPSGVELAGILARPSRVEHEEPQRAEIDRVLHRLAVSTGDAEVAAESSAVVVIARQRVQVRRERRQELAQQLVLLVGGVIGEVARQEDCIRLWTETPHGLDRSREPRYRLVVEPVRSDVRIAQLGKEKRRAADDETSSPTGSARTGGPLRRARLP